MKEPLKLKVETTDKKKDTTNSPQKQPRITSHFLCTPGCAHTGSFNSFCC